MRIIFSLVCFISEFLCLAQTIENPSFERCDVPALHITKVVIAKDTTYVFCSYYSEEGHWANISKDTYLRDTQSQISFPLLKCEGLPFGPEIRNFHQKGTYEILFYFPSIAESERIDFIENEGERAFNIYGINLKKSYKKSYSDIELKHMLEMISANDSVTNVEDSIQYKNYATSLNNLVSYNVSKGNFAEAVRLGTVEAAIRRKVFGSEDQRYINSLANLFTYNKELRNFTECARLQKDITTIKKNIYGVEHIEYASSLANLAVCYSDIGNNKEAARIGEEATALLKRIVGSESIIYLTSLTNLAYDNFEIGNYIEAIRLETEVAEILKTIDGAEYNYAMSLSRLGDYNTYMGNYNEALRIGTEAMKILKRAVGTEHADYAQSLSNLARLYDNLGNYIKAIALEEEALRIYEIVYGTEHHDYATALNNLAGYYQNIGDYCKTGELMTKSLELYKRLYGTDNSNYAISLNNLADYNCKVGNYSEAIRLGIEAMELYKKVIGTEHPLYATSLNNLANYYSNIGNYSEAIRLGTEALELYKRVLGTEHPDYATSLSNLSINYFKLGNYSEAIRWGTEAMEIRKRVLGMEHPDYARSLNSLAAYNRQINNYSEAIKLGTEAMEIRKRVLGMEHPLYATSLLNLASYYSEVGNYLESIKLGSEAMEILKKTLGAEHPYYMTALLHLTGYNIELNNTEKAFNCLNQFLNNSQPYVMQNFSELSSRNRETMWMNKYAYAYNTLLPYIVTKYQTKQSISELYDNTCLFAKGILLNTSIELQKMILESSDSVMIKKFNALSSNISIYNKLLNKPIKERFINVDSLNMVIEQQEMELSKESKAYGDYTHNLTISWKDVQRGLGDYDIAIEFLDFPIDNSDSIMYVALTLKRGYDSPHMVTLFDRKQLKAISEDDYYTQTNVSDLIWKPLAEELQGVRNVYFAPSGELHRIGIEYLPINKAENINEVYSLHRLSSTRQLAFIQDKTIGKKTILYGGINYDEKSSIFLTDTVSTEKSVLRTVSTRANVDSLSLRSSFDYLEGTKREVDMIAEDMELHSVPYIYYCGKDGSEESFKHLDGKKPKVIHIATHGFYFTETKAHNDYSVISKIGLLIEDIQNIGRLVEDKSMTRSGLLFSGCNRVIWNEQIPESEEDGILTAQEIAKLDLRGLDLVVLSACQTALGDMISGEGVFGLQRGFKKAGAKTILMSLDKVDDEATQILMVQFYKNLMSGKTKLQSLKDAQKHLRQVENGKYDDPKYWASFIMLDGID